MPPCVDARGLNWNQLSGCFLRFIPLPEPYKIMVVWIATRGCSWIAQVDLSCIKGPFLGPWQITARICVDFCGSTEGHADAWSLGCYRVRIWGPCCCWAHAHLGTQTVADDNIWVCGPDTAGDCVDIHSKCYHRGPCEPLFNHMLKFGDHAVFCTPSLAQGKLYALTQELTSPLADPEIADPEDPGIGELTPAPCVYPRYELLEHMKNQYCGMVGSPWLGSTAGYMRRD